MWRSSLADHGVETPWRRCPKMGSHSRRHDEERILLRTNMDPLADVSHVSHSLTICASSKVLRAHVNKATEIRPLLQDSEASQHIHSNHQEMNHCFKPQLFW